MRTILAIITAAGILSFAGCASGPGERPPDTVRGSSLHEQSERKQIWEDVYKEREKEARENMERPSGP